MPILSPIPDLVNQKLGAGAQHFQVLTSQTHYERWAAFRGTSRSLEQGPPGPEDPVIDNCYRKRLQVTDLS